MDSITLTFPKALNVSVQIGDTAYYTNDVNGIDIILIGTITAVFGKSITVDIDPSAVRPTITSFILFSKTAEVNTSGIKGYYAEMQFMNNSETEAELFTVGSEVVESSK
jgi:hypothetical protein|tara:strand:- start:10490 stop:10816 length:327 start_codon:yes stop_codon:yes gene_type:complete